MTPDEQQPAADWDEDLAEQVTQIGRLAAKLARDLDPDQQAQLREHLAARINTTSPAAWRETQLGLLVQLIKDHGMDLERSTYNQVQAEREMEGKSWPTAEQLLREFLWWPGVLSAGLNLLDDQLRGIYNRSPHAYLTQGHHPDECKAALIAAYRVLGFWPEAWVYDQWAADAREHARITGAADPRRPSQAWIKEKLGDRCAGLGRRRRCLRTEIGVDRRL